MPERTIIQKKSLADKVADRLRKEIQAGKFGLMEKLPTETQLMQKYGVGRSSIREAIRILANVGLLSVQQGVGTFVKALNPPTEPMDQRLKRANIYELDEVRKLLELKIAEKAAMMRTEEDILQIEHFLRERQRSGLCGELEKCIEADVNFHTAIAKASHNEILFDLYKSVSVHLQNWFQSIFTDTGSFVSSQYLHEKLLKHIVAGEPKKAWNTASKILDH